jgi:RHS repeat-associated protein
MSDQVTGLVLVVHEDSGAREYDPEIGRWVERDPIGFAGGLDTFDYVDDSPVDHVDRSGLLSDFDLTCGVQGASRERVREAFVDAAPGVALVGAVGGVAAIAVVAAPPPVKAAVVGGDRASVLGSQDGRVRGRADRSWGRGGGWGTLCGGCKGGLVTWKNRHQQGAFKLGIGPGNQEGGWRPLDGSREQGDRHLDRCGKPCK